MAKEPISKDLQQDTGTSKDSGPGGERAQSRLTSEKWLLNTLLDNLNVGVFLVEAPSGKPILANRHAENLLGRGLLKGVEKNSLAEAYKAYKLDTDEYYPEAEMPIVRGLKGEFTSADNMVVVQPDGRRVLLEVFGCPVKDDQDNVIASLATFSDITVRKQAEEALHQSLEKFEKTFKAAPIWVVLSSIEDGRYLEVNRAFLNSTGFQRGEVIGKTSLELDTWADPGDRAWIVAVIKERGGVRNYAVQRKKRSGEIIETLFSAELLQLKDQQVMISVSQDITEWKRTETEHEKLHAQLQQAQKMESVGRLAGGVAHDFNNMLGVIIGNADLALQNIDPSQSVYHDLIEIKNAAKRSADLTRQLLAFARRQTADPVVLDLNDTVSGMLKMLRRLIGEDIELVWMPGGNLWPAKIDPAQIDQVLANLCVNARDAIDGVGKIAIETRNIRFDHIHDMDDPEFIPGEYVMLAVGDNGCGMDQETLNNLFEPFFTTKKVGEGTGLGLSTVYGIVKQNNGFIKVTSDPARGSSFRIYLPKAAESLKDDEKAAAIPIATGTETILIVEDERAILQMCKAMLERYGYTVLLALQPHEALEIVSRHTGPIHLLVADVVMPEMDGKELKNLIEKHRPGIKMLFISGYSADVIMNHGILKDNVNFLQKPFTVDKLVNKVRDVLDKPL